MKFKKALCSGMFGGINRAITIGAVAAIILTIAATPSQANDAIQTPSIFQNPFMAPNNFSAIHFNSFQTDTTSVSGPASASSQAVQQGLLRPITAIAGTIAFNSIGQILTIRVGPSLRNPGFDDQTLLLINPATFQVLDEVDLPPRPSSNGTVSFSGGGYFYVDNLDRVVCVTANQQIRIYAVKNNQFALPPQTYDLSTQINNSSDIPNSVLPDSAGNLWFITAQGKVGYISNPNNSSGTIYINDINEPISKSFATDEDGGVYVVTNYALYRFRVGSDGMPQNTWRSKYNRGRREKPGQNQQGSGTTPTLFNDFAGNQFVTIADNADPFMDVDVYNRQTGALVAQQRVFRAFPLRNSCENSLIAVNHSIIIENNYGNSSPLSTFGPLTTVPGVDRVDFNPTTGKSQVVWENTSVAIPSVVSQLSTGDGLVYTYAKDAQGWYYAALDFQDGSLTAQSRIPLSNQLGGLLANNFYSGIGIGPEGSAYVGVFGGILAWRPE